MQAYKSNRHVHVINMHLCGPFTHPFNMRRQETSEK